jgi:hypothetical protein
VELGTSVTKAMLAKSQSAAKNTGQRRGARAVFQTNEETKSQEDSLSKKNFNVSEQDEETKLLKKVIKDSKKLNKCLLCDSTLKSYTGLGKHMHKHHAGQLNSFSASRMAGAPESS